MMVSKTMDSKRVDSTMTSSSPRKRNPLDDLAKPAHQKAEETTAAAKIRGQQEKG